MTPEAACNLKRRFSLKVKAQVHAIGRMNDPRHAKRCNEPLYVYECPICKGWHLTRRPQFPDLAELVAINSQSS